MDKIERTVDVKLSVCIWVGSSEKRHISVGEAYRILKGLNVILSKENTLPWSCIAIFMDGYEEHISVKEAGDLREELNFILRKTKAALIDLF